MVRWILLLALHGAPTAPETVPPTPRQVFLSAVAALQDVGAEEFPLRLGAFVDAQLAAGRGETPALARARRSAFLIGMGALFDAGDTLLAVPLLGRAFAEIVLPEEKELRHRICASARLHGRHDSPKHFFLAAALTARGGPAAAAQASLQKEIEDSRRTDRDPPAGTGFSFVDLAYDHAGIRFAAHILGWRDSSLLSREAPPLVRFLPPFPELALPEGIGWQRYIDEYRGEPTEKWLDSIHAAIDARLAEQEPEATSPSSPRAHERDATPTDRNGQSP